MPTRLPLSILLAAIGACLPAAAQDVLAPRDVLIALNATEAPATSQTFAGREAAPQGDRTRATSSTIRAAGNMIRVTAPTVVVEAQPKTSNVTIVSGAPLSFPLEGAVKNAPYSAQVITEQMQSLADGNQITNRSVSRSFRDSQGRIRLETDDAQGKLAMVTLHDPAASANILLDPLHKRATRTHLPGGLTRAASSPKGVREARAIVPNVGGPVAQRIEQRLVMRPVGSEPVSVTFRAQEAGGPGSGTLLLAERLGPHISTAMTDRKWAAMATTRDLGTKEIEGVKAKGALVSYEIPAGEIGNRQPIVVSREEWFSPELNVLVYSRHSDPRSGERIYRLANIRRDEPAAGLFNIPADYTVREVRPGTQRAAVAERPGRPERPEKGERREKAERPEKVERPERVEIKRPERAERAEKPEQPERPERPD